METNQHPENIIQHPQLGRILIAQYSTDISIVYNFPLLSLSRWFQPEKISMCLEYKLKLQLLQSTFKYINRIFYHHRCSNKNRVHRLSNKYSYNIYTTEHTELLYNCTHTVVMWNDRCMARTNGNIQNTLRLHNKMFEHCLQNIYR